MAGAGLEKGDAECASGLSKRIFDRWTADTRSGFVDPLEGDALGSVKSLCWAVAQAVVDEIQENAKVNGERVE
jgi:hypothetical protein